MTVPLSAGAAHAFSVYVAGEWWPTAWSSDREHFEKLVIQPRVGGRVLARYDDGRQEDWGEVLDYQSGRRVEHTFSYAHTSGVPSVVVAEFVDRSEGGCDLQFRHRGWTEDNAQDQARFANWAERLDEFADASEFDLRPPQTPPE